ncbi:hypothetical protein BGZ83_000188 [Gryganskiella cystojenkinii]|nr:hypothetical protein BGZ83_000188 [Gryganskiella cystojenkinii]
MSFFFLIAALPFLYQDPACPPGFYPTKSLYYPSLYKSVQNILRQRPPNEITDLLNAAFDVFPEHVIEKEVEGTSKDHNHAEKKDDPKEPADFEKSYEDQDQLQVQDLIKKRVINYLSYTRIFSFENVVFKEFDRRGRWDYPARLLDYALKSSATGEIATEYGQGDHDQDLLFPPLKIMLSVLASPYNLTWHIPANMRHFRQAALATSIRRDLTWAFCSPVMENVELLTIPLSDIDRYLACVSNFKSLINVSFLMDEFFDSRIVGERSANTFNSNNSAGLFGQEAMDGPPVDQELEEIKKAMRVKRNQQFKTMFEFVRQHLVHFPKQLRQAECPPDSTWEIGGVGWTHCSQEIFDELKSLLPAENRVSMIDYTNIIQVANHIQETNLDFVKEIKLLGFETEEAVTKLIANLKRCRGLNRFSSQHTGPESFKWAVQERLAWNRYHAAVTAKAAAIRAESETKFVFSSVSPVPPPLPLVPLETIRVNTPTQRELDDIVFAFGTALKDLSAVVGALESQAGGGAAEVTNAIPGQPFTPVLFDFHIVADPYWSQLPALTKIELNAFGRVRITIGPDFSTSLGSCRTKCRDDQGFDANLKDDNDLSNDNEDNNGNDNHKLESLTIVDSSSGPYRCENLQSCEPFLEPRPKMTHIYLSGYAALVFHPDCLLHTPNLQQLRLGHSRYQGWSFIPPVEELEASFRLSGGALQGSNKSLSLSTTEPPALGHRAAWTWDWQLPRLTLLQLSGEFGFLFKFRMLAGCPSLDSLWIDITTREGLHKRVLSVEDFMTKSSVSNGDNEQDRQSDVITSSLKYLTLSGPWFLNDETIQVMYGGTLNRPAVFSKLAELSEQSISAGYSFEAWLGLMERLPDLKRARCGLYEQREVGAEILMNEYGLIARPTWVIGSDGRQTLEETVPLKDAEYHISGRYWSFPKDAAEDIPECKEE